MQAPRTAEIIAVGSELLTPHRQDTNSLFLTAALNELGIVVRAKTIVGDDRSDVVCAVRHALERTDLVVTTGGLGPTEDDLTREAVAAVLQLPLEEDASVLAAIEERFARRGLPMPAINRRQARVPRGATVLPNPNGTAPGLLLEAGGRLLVLLPGPPREVQPMFASDVAPRLRALGAPRALGRRVIRTTGRPESQIDELAYPVYAPLAQGEVPIETTILAVAGQIEIHLQATGSDAAAVDRALDDAVRAVARAIGPPVFSTDGRSLEAVVGDRLRELGLRIAVAESCTAGLMLARLTDVPGSSAYVVGGVVAYANSVKVAELGVAEKAIAEHGAVSEQVALAMAEGVRRRLGANVGVAITGVAGPSGGSEAKPVGTVVMAVTGPETRVRTARFAGDRHTVRVSAVTAALDLVRRTLE